MKYRWFMMKIKTEVVYNGMCEKSKSLQDAHRTWVMHVLRQEGMVIASNSFRPTERKHTRVVIN